MFIMSFSAVFKVHIWTLSTVDHNSCFFILVLVLRVMSGHDHNGICNVRLPVKIV